MKYAMALLLLCAFLTSLAQNDGLTLYAYEQKVSPGIAPAKTTQTNTRHHIFLLTPHNKTIDPVSLWIKGKLFGINVKEATAPVLQQSANNATIVLVPETNQQVLRLFPTKSTAPGKEQKGASLARQNEVVLVYKLKGKFHYIVIKHMDQLDPVNMQ